MSKPPPRTMPSENDPWVAEFLFDLFHSALFSVRVESVCNPFPPFFKSNENGDGSSSSSSSRSASPISMKREKRVTEARDALKSIVMNTSMTKPILEFIASLPLSTQLLANWITTPSEKFKLSLDSMPNHAHHEPYILKFKTTGKNSSTTDVPLDQVSAIYEVQWNDQIPSTFADLANKYGTVHAFHGSNLEHFWSIYNSGLQGHLNKRDLFGPGIYFSTEADVALSFASSGIIRPESMLSKRFSKYLVIALCEIMNHPGKENRKKVEGMSVAFQDAVPSTYLVVKNNDFIRVRYLLVYGTSTPSSTSRNALPAREDLRSPAQPPNWVLKLRKYWGVIAIVLYFAAMVLIGNSERFSHTDFKLSKPARGPKKRGGSRSKPRQ